VEILLAEKVALPVRVRIFRFLAFVEDPMDYLSTKFQPDRITHASLYPVSVFRLPVQLTGEAEVKSGQFKNAPLVFSSSITYPKISPIGPLTKKLWNLMEKNKEKKTPQDGDEHYSPAPLRGTLGNNVRDNISIRDL